MVKDLYTVGDLSSCSMTLRVFGDPQTQVMWRLTLSFQWRRAAAQASPSISWTSQEDLCLLCLYVVFRLSKLNASRTQSGLLFEAHLAEGYKLTFLSGVCSKASLNVAVLHQRHLGDLESPPCGYTCYAVPLLRELVSACFNRDCYPRRELCGTAKITLAEEVHSHPSVLHHRWYLGAFAKLRNVTISFVMSVCLSVCLFVRIEQLCSPWTDFHESYIWGCYENLSSKLTFH
jgi:hypothetical protein